MCLNRIFLFLLELSSQFFSKLYRNKFLGVFQIRYDFVQIFLWNFLNSTIATIHCRYLNHDTYLQIMIFKQFVFIISAGGHELLSFSCCRKSNWTIIISSIIMYFLLLWWPHYPAWLPLIFNKDDSRTIISNRWTHNLLHNMQLDNDSKSKKSHIVSARCQDEYFVTNMRWRQRSDLHWDLLLWSVKLGLFVKIFYFVSRFNNVFIMALCTTVWSNCDNNWNWSQM